MCRKEPTIKIGDASLEKKNKRKMNNFAILLIGSKNSGLLLFSLL